MEGEMPILLLTPGKNAQQSGVPLTDRQARAVKHMVENGGSKADALRAADYSETIIKNPDRVFNSPHVMEVLERTLKSPDKALLKLEKLVDARRVEHLTWPPFNTEKAQDHIMQDDVEGTDHSEKIRGEQMTDEDIREYLSEQGIDVKRIVHGDQMRHVYCWRPDTAAQLEAIDKIINLFGLYAPKKIEGNFKHKVGVFSMKDLRQKMRDNGVPVIRQ